MAAKKETSLTIGELKRLANHEEIIERGVQSFIDVGNALAAIRDERLYTDVDKTFEGYCKKRWGFSRQRAYQLIDSAKVIDVVSTVVDTQPPVNERQARVLAALPDEQTQATVWAKAVETAPKDESGEPVVTAAHVKRVAEEVAAKPEKPVKAVEIVEPEDEAEEPADGWGVPIQPHAKEAFEAAPLFDELLSLLRKADKLYSELANTKGGEYLLRPGVSINARDRWKHAGIKDAIMALQDSKPTYTVCPYAYHAAAFPESKHKHDKNCTLCKGLNWSRALGKEEINEQVVAKIKEAFGV